MINEELWKGIDASDGGMIKVLGCRATMDHVNALSMGS